MKISNIYNTWNSNMLCRFYKIERHTAMNQYCSFIVQLKSFNPLRGWQRGMKMIVDISIEMYIGSHFTTGNIIIYRLLRHVSKETKNIYILTCSYVVLFRVYRLCLNFRPKTSWNMDFGASYHRIFSIHFFILHLPYNWAAGFRTSCVAFGTDM